MHVVRGLEEKKVNIKSSEITYIPKSTVEVSKKDAEKVLKLINILDDHEDVQSVYSNIDIPEEILQEAG
jgi:transcriptional/translational regulatory protein YebC/TACO1